MFYNATNFAFKNNLYCTCDDKTSKCNYNSKSLNVPSNKTIQESVNGFVKEIGLYCGDLISRIEINKLCEKTEIIYSPSQFNPPKDMTIINFLYYNNFIIGFIGLDNSNNIWITFRGTETITEWYQDFTVSQKLINLNTNNNLEKISFLENENVYCHSGFLTIYETFKEKILNSIKSIKNINNIIITGHSLGSALATLTTLNLIELNYKNIYTYVFASPRVGNKELAKTITNVGKGKNLKCFYRINNLSDIIPTIPPPVSPNLDNVNIPSLYKHGGIAINYGENRGSITANHSMINYMYNLSKFN